MSTRQGGSGKAAVAGSGLRRTRWTRRSAQPLRPSPAAAVGGSRRTAIFAVLSAMAMVVLDAGIATVALPTVGRSLHVTPAESVLVVVAYQAAVLMALLPFGALGERFGHRRMFANGVAIFTVATGLSSLAPSFPFLLAARFLQGIGGGAVMALGVALLRQTVTHDRLGAAIGWNALTVALASAAAPALGAVIVSGGDWRWIYVVNLPVCLAVLWATRALPEGVTRTGSFDWISTGLNAALFGLLIVGAQLVVADTAVAALVLGGAALSLGALIGREWGKTAPLLPLDLLRARSFRIPVIASVCCFSGQTAALVALPFYLHGLGQSALVTGLYMTVWPLGVALTAPIAGRLADRAPNAWLCAAGAACLAAGLGGAALLSPEGDPRLLIPMMALCGAGFGLFQTPNNRSMFLAAPLERSGAAGGMQGTARVAGQTAGALMMTVLFSVTTVQSASRTGLATAAFILIAAALVSIINVRPASRPWS